MGDISSGITPIGAGPPQPQAAQPAPSQTLRGDGTSVPEATTGVTSSRVTENAQVRSSRATLSIAGQQTQPQSAIDFNTLLLLSALLGNDEEKNKNNPFMLLVGFALLSALQQQSQNAQFLRFDSQSYEISQSVSSTDAVSTQSAGYQQATGIDPGTSLGGQIDVSG